MISLSLTPVIEFYLRRVVLAGDHLKNQNLALPLNRLELGKLYFKIVDFEAAIRSLSEGLVEARANEDWAKWCQYVPLLLRIWAERLDFTSIEALKAELHTLEQAGCLEPHSTTCYALGIAASYENQPAVAEVHFANALKLAIDVHESAQARFGLAAVDVQFGRYPEALERLKLLDCDLSSTLLTDLKLATGLLTAVCYRSLRQFDEAFELLAPLQKTCRLEQNLYMSLNVLFCYGSLYQERGDGVKARQYYEMMQTLLVPQELCHLALQVEKRLTELDQRTASRAVLQLIENGTRTLITPDLGRVEIGNQFLLLSLLKILAQEPGVRMTKEDITLRLWKQEYNPLVHDNKIYVTIRRLRSMIESDRQKPFYILSAQDGYMFNPNVEFKVQA